MGAAAGGGAVTQTLTTPGDLQHSYKDSTRPPPRSTQDGATEGSSAAWKPSHKLLLQSGREFSQCCLKMGLTHP